MRRRGASKQMKEPANWAAKILNGSGRRDGVIASCSIQRIEHPQEIAGEGDLMWPPAL
jgi:hypothetical protein